MIIVVDESLFNGGSSQAMKRAAIEEICVAVRRGYHYLFGTRDILSEMFEFPGITPESKAVVDGVRRSYASNAGFLRSFGFRVVVKDGIGVSRKISDKSWEVPVSQVVEHGISPLGLLGEHSRDAELYKEAAKHFILNKKLGISLAAIARNGNGSGTARELTSFVREMREWILCITDTDKYCPDDTLGDVAASCKKVADETGWVAIHYAIGGRSIENVIPHNFIEDAVQGESRDAVAHLKALTATHGLEFADYANLKDGIASKWVREQSTDTPRRKFWERLVQAEGGSLNACCTGHAVCPKTPCARRWIGGFGGALPEQVQRHLDVTSKHKAAERAKTSANVIHWEAIGELVCQMALAPPKMRL